MIQYGGIMRKLMHWLLKPYFDQIEADIDYLLMLEGEK